MKDYNPKRRELRPVVESGEFKFAAAFFEHPHIYGQINGLLQAGAELTMIYDTDALRLKQLKEKYPKAKVARCFDEILEDGSIHLVTAAAIPCERASIGCRVMLAGKDYFTDKCPFTTLGQLETAKQIVETSGRRYAVYYSERINSESALYADELIQAGVIGEIVHMEIFGPHRLKRETRSDWFFDKSKTGGILTDIASHQFEQFLHFSRCDEGKVVHAAVDNRANPNYPDFEDVGQAVLLLDNGVQCFSRVNWFTPDGMQGWGDGRVFITGTKGYIEIRKQFDLGRGPEKDQIFLVDENSEQVIPVAGKIGTPYYSQLILDCLNRTEYAMTQYHAFQAAMLSMEAQALANRL